MRLMRFGYARLKLAMHSPCVKELVTRPGKERFARYLAFYFNWISLLQPVSNLASLDRDKIGLLLLHVCVYVGVFSFFDSYVDSWSTRDRFIFSRRYDINSFRPSIIE